MPEKLKRKHDRQEAKRIVFVLIDGLGDIAIPELGYQTPLQKAVTPAMDAVAFAGLNGLMDPVEPGLACGSDTAHMSIFGYDPRKLYRGRGAFEALGSGLDLDVGDVAFKCNFATIADTGDTSPLVERRRVDRKFSEWGKDLCVYLNDNTLPKFPGVRISVKYATEHRCGVVIRGKGLCDSITGTDPLKDNLPLCISEPLNDSPEALYSSQVLNEVSRFFTEMLMKHPINLERIKQNQPPANAVLLRGPGEKINVKPFDEVHGMNAFMIAPTCIIAGLGRSLGIDIVKAPGATGDYDTNLLSKSKEAIKAFQDSEKNYEFGFIHIKAVDDAGHDKDVDKKVEFIEKADAMIADLLQQLSQQYSDLNKIAIVITGDHTTQVLHGDHTFEPVPFTISDLQSAAKTYNHSKPSDPPSLSNLRDSVNKFSEIAAADGCLGRFPGGELMPLLKQFRCKI